VDEERAAGFVLFRAVGDERRYLLLRHRDGDHWGFPKGRIERGEDESAAAWRELREETGIRELIPVPGFSERSSYPVVRDGGRVEKTVTYFLGEVHDGETVQLSPEHVAALWLDYDAALRTLTHDETRRILNAAVRFLNSLDGRKSVET
jgi:bis(5'-nucleosidyl)-tetraphosphatase